MILNIKNTLPGELTSRAGCPIIHANKTMPTKRLRRSVQSSPKRDCTSFCFWHLPLGVLGISGTIW